MSFAKQHVPPKAREYHASLFSPLPFDLHERLSSDNHTEPSLPNDCVHSSHTVGAEDGPGSSTVEVESAEPGLNRMSSMAQLSEADAKGMEPKDVMRKELEQLTEQMGKRREQREQNKRSPKKLIEELVTA